MKIGIVDTGLGTTASMKNMIKRAGSSSDLVSDPSSLSEYSHVVLPGVGHFSEGAVRLASQGWIGPLREHAEAQKKLLGVCLGMQLLGHSSEEGEGAGLEIFDFRVERLAVMKNIRIPHMGWNTVRSRDSVDVYEGDRFYFVHSFAVPADHDSVIGLSTHGVEFGSIVQKGSVIGAQFHPEKSHKFGLKFLSEFLRD